MSAPLLEIEDLAVRFRVMGLVDSLFRHGPRYVDAVAHVSLSLERGSTLAIVGESGSGKTTLARAILGLVPVAGGDIRLEGRSIIDRSDRRMKDARRLMAMTFQDPIGSLNPRLSVRTSLAEPFRVHGIGTADLDDRVSRLLDLVGLPRGFADRYPHELSGGQARRVGVARALSLEPRLIIADEPTAGLDVSIQGEILNLFNELQDRLGVAFLIITHNLSIVRHIAGRTAVMYLGRIVEEAPSEQLFATPRHPYTLALTSANPEPDPDARRRRFQLTGETPSLFARPDGCELNPRCPMATERCRSLAPAAQVLDHTARVTCHFPLGLDRRPEG